jgi:hypothetical protein
MLPWLSGNGTWFTPRGSQVRILPGVLMFVRFVITIRDARSHQKLGVIRAIQRYRELIDRDDWDLIEEHVAWLNQHVRVPSRFSRSRKRHATKKAISWLKDDAAAPFARVRAIATILERNRIATEQLTTYRPGYVVYEDDSQVAAIPFRDTMVNAVRITRQNLAYASG